MSTQLLDPAEVVCRGKSIYEQRLRELVEEKHRGKFLVIDVDTGEYEIDPEHLAAAERLLAKRPGAQLFGMKIGEPTAYRLGGGLRHSLQ